MAKLKMNIINSKETKTDSEAKAAAINVMCRSIAARQDNPAFTSAEHLRRVEAARLIARNFFTVRENIFENHRPNTREKRPFTAVKVYRTQWPRVSPKVADAKFYQPLEALGNIELRRDQDGTSHIIRVYL